MSDLLREPETVPARLVLVADDDPSIGPIITRMLQTLGFTTLVVSNGAAAVSAAATYGTGLACALLDVQMPVMNGIDAARAIQQSVPTLEIALMSGSVPSELREQMYQLRIVGFLPKPFTRAELHTVIRAATVGAVRRMNR